MKLSRKILSLVLALVMVMGLAATAFAEEGGETTTNGSITIWKATMQRRKYMPTRPILPGKNG